MLWPTQDALPAAAAAVTSGPSCAQGSTLLHCATAEQCESAALTSSSIWRSLALTSSISAGAAGGVAGPAITVHAIVNSWDERRHAIGRAWGFHGLQQEQAFGEDTQCRGQSRSCHTLHIDSWADGGEGEGEGDAMS